MALWARTGSEKVALLEIFDMPASIAFYRDSLGFEVVQTSHPGNDFTWALLELAADGATAYSRMFGFGVVEDPATGNASGPLGSYLVHHEVVPPERASHMVSRQGVKMGRPSDIHIAVETSRANITRVRIGGSAVLLAEGTMTISR